MKKIAAKKELVKQNKRVRVGDKVVVITGAHRGTVGTVLSRKGEDGLVIQGVNMRKKCTKKSEANPKGGIVEFEAPINASNVLLCTDEGKGYRAKVSVSKKGERSLYGIVDGKEVTKRQIKAKSV